jgi:hypothetical protein
MKILVKVIQILTKIGFEIPILNNQMLLNRFLIMKFEINNWCPSK